MLTMCSALDEDAMVAEGDTDMALVPSSCEDHTFVVVEVVDVVVASCKDQLMAKSYLST
jgi:hypothetical protein